ncbi:MAG TPA: type III pantothenate kinase, partial [Bacteroidales bacterium]|nr:type III pantothenate kinase [Bacteroidales bacterium]
HPEITLSLIRRFIVKHPGIQRCILSTVIDYPSPIKRFLSSKLFFLELDEKTPLPLKNRYRSPATLGKDRLAAAVGGTALFPGEPVLVINAGTCITYDLVSSRNEYLGGAITPGLQMRLQALHTFTGKLPLISLRNSEILTGRTTEESILSGVLAGTAAEMEGMVDRFSAQNPELKTILSGGDQNYFNKRLKISIFARPNIVLSGLQQILQFNVDTTP